jgi:hypothetical protein
MEFELRQHKWLAPASQFRSLQKITPTRVTTIAYIVLSVRRETLFPTETISNVMSGQYLNLHPSLTTTERLANETNVSTQHL